MRSHDANLALRHDRVVAEPRPAMPAYDLDSLDEAARQFQSFRPRLFGIAYRVVGTVSEAEDVVQDVWIKWQAYDRTKVESPEAFLVTATTRAAINVLQSARVRRESYVGPWLPEPISTESNPELEVEHNESLSLGLLVLMEALSPSERAAFVLREAFGYEYRAIAEILDTTETASRKLVSRGRQHLATGRRNRVASSRHRELLLAFIAAARAGDVAELERVLAADVVSLSDGGDVVHAARIAIIGRERVAKFVAAFSTWFWTGVDVQEFELNGEPAVAVVVRGEPVTVLAISPAENDIARLFWMLNPEKLARIAVAQPA